MNTKGKFKYEMHIHTCEGSLCSDAPGDGYPEVFKSQGYDGIVITNHFYRGNCAVDRNLSWDEFVDNYWLGYEKAKEAGDKIGLKVFFGIEENFHGDEFLIYGLTKEWMKAHPDMKTWTAEEYSKQVHSAGGVIVQPHPFRECDYIPEVVLHPYQVDAIEAVNSGNDPYQDVLASNYAKIFNLPVVSGSDIHHYDKVAETVTALYLDEELNSIEDYVRIIKSRKGFTPVIPDDRTGDIKTAKRPSRPIRIWTKSGDTEIIEFEKLFGLS